MSSASSTYSSEVSSSPFSPPISPLKANAARAQSNSFGQRRDSLRIDTLGIPPSELVGKVLKRVSRSANHPAVTLHFTDNTAFQIRVDGYDPMYPGIPKEIETDPALEPIFAALEDRSAAYTISHAKIVTLTDRAFELGEKETRWDQNHSAVAFKFEEEGKWHCVWVSLAEYDGHGRRCIFRSFDDVYLDRLDRSPKRRRRGQKGYRSNGEGRKAAL